MANLGIDILSLFGLSEEKPRKLTDEERRVWGLMLLPEINNAAEDALKDVDPSQVMTGGLPERRDEPGQQSLRASPYELPFNQYGGENNLWEFATEQSWPAKAARDFWEAAQYPGEVWRGEKSGYGPEAIENMFNLAGGVTLGAGALPAQGLRAGIASRPFSALPMDEASRMARAADMGFNTDAYHATLATDDFDVFQLGKRAKDSQENNAMGIHFGTPGQGMHRLMDILGGIENAADDPFRARILPLKLRANNPLEMKDIGAWNVKNFLRNTQYDDRLKEKALEKGSSWPHMVDQWQHEIRDHGPDIYGDVSKDVYNALKFFGYDSIRYLNEMEMDKFLPKGTFEVEWGVPPGGAGSYGYYPKVGEETLSEVTNRNFNIADRSGYKGSHRAYGVIPGQYGFGGPSGYEDATKWAESLGLTKEGARQFADSYMIWDPTSIRSRWANFDPKMKDVPGLLYAGGKGGAVAGGAAAASKGLADPFYSQLDRAINQASFDRAPAQQWAGYLKNKPGVKQEELDWHEILSMLQNRADMSVSKEELVQQMARRPTKLNEEIYDKNISDLSLKELREMAIDHAVDEPEEIAKWNRTQLIESLSEVENAYFPGVHQYSDWTMPGGENYQERLYTLPGNVFEDEHFPDLGMIGHLRRSDRLVDNKPTIFAEELQSFLHQAGRKEGYKVSPDKIDMQQANWQVKDHTDKLLDQHQDAIKHAQPQYLNDPKREWNQRPSPDHRFYYVFNPEPEKTRPLKKVWATSPEEAKQIVAADPETPWKFQWDRIEDAPYKKSWPDMLLKNLVRQAAMEGKDQVAWTTSKSQADRYGEGVEEGMKGFYDNELVFRANKLFKPYGVKVRKGSTLNRTPPLTDVRDMADKIGIVNYVKYSPTGSPSRSAWARLETANGNLSKSIEDAKNDWYKLMDQRPAEMRSGPALDRNSPIVKEFQARSDHLQNTMTVLGQWRDKIVKGYTDDPNWKGSPEDVWVMDVTPELKRVVLEEGQTMFAGGKGGAVAGGGVAASKGIADPFYSQLERSINQASFDRAPGKQWEGYLKNRPGVKQEELDWHNMLAMLQDRGDTPVAREELVQQMSRRPTKLKEVVKDRIEPNELSEDDWQAALNYIDDGNAGDYSEYPEMQDALERGDRDFVYEFLMNEEWVPPSMTRYSSWSEPGGANYQERLYTLPQSNWIESNYQHWDEPGQMGHLRRSDRTVDGKTTLFAEELQSFLHQEGKKKGYMSDISKEVEKLDPAKFGVMKYNYNSSADPKLAHYMLTYPDVEGNHTIQLGGYLADSPEDAIRQALTPENYERIARYLQHDKVEDAPYKKSWPDMLLKNLVRQAAMEGHDQIAWTTGDMQAGRYGFGMGDEREKGMEAFYDNELVFRANKLFKPYGVKVKKGQMDTKTPDFTDVREPMRRYQIGPYNPGSVIGGDPTVKPAWEALMKRDGNIQAALEDANEMHRKINEEYNAKKAQGGNDWIMRGTGGANPTSESNPDYLDYIRRREEVRNLVGKLNEWRTYLTQSFEKDPNWKGSPKEVWTLEITPELRRVAMEEGFPMFQGGRGGLAAGAPTLLDEDAPRDLDYGSKKISDEDRRRLARALAKKAGYEEGAEVY